MTINSKSDNDKFTLFPDGTLHLYDNLREVQREDHTEYEGELFIMHTALTQAEVEAQFDSLLAVEKAKWAVVVAKAEAQRAQKVLADTDYKIIKAMEKLLVAQGLVESRESLRDAVRGAM